MRSRPRSAPPSPTHANRRAARASARSRVRIGHIGQSRPRHNPSPARNRAQRRWPAAAQRGEALGQQPLEPVRIKSARVHHQPVARLRPHHDLRRRAPRQTRLERLAQLAHVRLDHSDRRRRRVVPPQAVHQGRPAHDLVRPDEEHRQHEPLLRTQRSQTTPSRTTDSGPSNPNSISTEPSPAGLQRS